MNFLKNKYSERKEFILKSETSNQEKSNLINDLNNYFNIMSGIGINNEKDFKDFFYITSHAEKIIQDILKTKLDEVNLAKISSIIYKNREEYPINTIINFYKSAKNAIDNSNLTIKKKAYPQAYEDHYVLAPHNLNKWIEKTREIYAMVQQGYDLGNAFDIITKEWDNMEKFDFKSWLNFYQSGQHESYKTAQYGGNLNQQPQFEVGDGVRINPQQLKAKIPGLPQVFQPDQKEQIQQEKQRIDKEELAEKSRQLIGRLNSAEKIFTSSDFKKMLGNEYEVWLETLHTLKRKIQISNIRTAQMIEDMIILSGNKLRAQGFNKSANIMIKLAQEVPVAPPTADTPVPDLLGDIGEESNIAAEPMPSLDTASPDAKDLSDPDGAMKEFVENLGGDIEETKRKDKKAADEFIAMYITAIGKQADFDGALISVGEEPIIRVAQVIEDTIVPAGPGEKVPGTKPIQAPVGNSDAVDDAISAALQNITLADIIDKLEDLSSLFSNRQVVRELTTVDLMMQAKGIASFFPSLAEATKSALDSNQYVLTRIEDILAKLKGAVGTSDGSLDQMKAKLEVSEENKAKKKEQREMVDMQPTPPAGQIPNEEGGPEVKPAPELKQPVQVATPGQGVRV